MEARTQFSMLLRFGCSNFLSIDSFQELSLLASSWRKDDKAREGQALIDVPHTRNKVLTRAAIYGANASGKSNFLKSLLFMKKIVVNSQTKSKPGEAIDNTAFLLSQNSEMEVSHFECDFVEGGVRYSYGFAISQHRIKSEFLYAFPKGHKQIWFSRDSDAKDRFKFGKYLKGHNALIAELTRSNSLFLSAAAQQNHEQLGPIYSFFANKIDSPAPALPVLLNTAGKERILHFLELADFGIADIKIVSKRMDSQVVELLRLWQEKFSEEKEERDISSHRAKGLRTCSCHLRAKAQEQ
jgi:uncharacterized protein